MRAVIQRVSSASVVVKGKSVGAVGPGLLVLLGVGQQDGDADVAWMAKKVSALRIFEDDAGKMNRSVLETSKAVLVVSQFTLYADTAKGNRPSFVNAGEPKMAEALYRRFCEACRGGGLTVETGEFGADMQVSLVNDGPVTICLDSKSP